MRRDLVQQVRETLAQAGYFVSSDARVRPLSFDLVARRDGHLVLVKVLSNVDSISDAVAQELRVLAEFLNGSAILVGERSSARDLEPGAVYARHGITIMRPETLADHLLQGIPPLVFAAPGGFYVNLDGERLRRIREERGVSLGQLAEAAGVSRRAISMYEEGMAAMVEVAERLEAFLDEPLVAPVDPFKFRASSKEAVIDLMALQDAIRREVLVQMEGLGFRVAPVEKGPLAGIAASKADELVLSGITNEAPEAARHAEALANLAEVTETKGAFFVRRMTSRVDVAGLPLVGFDELAKLDDAADVLSLIEERRKRAPR